MDAAGARGDHAAGPRRHAAPLPGDATLPPCACDRCCAIFRADAQRTLPYCSLLTVAVNAAGVHEAAAVPVLKSTLHVAM